MKEAIPTQFEGIFSLGYDSSKDSEENNFNSPEADPENIFTNQTKENSEQLSSKILNFPFTLDSYTLIHLETNDKYELGGDELCIIFGNLTNFKNNELILKLEFVTKEKKFPLNLEEYKNEIESLINPDIEFIGLFQNKLFLKYENENMTNDAYISLQKSSALFDLLYEEENDFNISEENTEKKNRKKSEDKKEESKNVNKNDDNYINSGNKNIGNNKINNNIGEINNSNINVKKNLFPRNNPFNNKMIELQSKQNILNPFFFPSPLLYNPFLFPINNLQKIPPINPLLVSQMSRSNQLFLSTNLAFQNIMKLQQQVQNKNMNKIYGNNNQKEIFNNIKNINQINNNNINNKINIYLNMNKNNNLSPINNKESSTNSNSSSSSSKESSPQINYQSKYIKNFKIESNDNKINNNLPKNIDDNLEEIVQNKQYKEYIPKKIKEKEVKFQTNSTRDYKLKYVSRYIVQIENEKNFPVRNMIIGNKGMQLRNILYNNCIKYGDQSTKIRLRGRGSGYKEGPNKEESKEPMELCISSLNLISFTNCSVEIENLLKQIYYKYYVYQCNNYIEQSKDKNNNNDKLTNETPIVMKNILKYHYIVDRKNTLIKEEKRRKKEEELNNNKTEKCNNSDN